MASYQTKFKVGRKLEGVDTATASDNQISALFRFDEEGNEDHVSLSIESDAMDPDDVFAVFQLLHDRGCLTARQSKTWLHQPKASVETHGETTAWGGVDLAQKVSMLEKGLKLRTGAGPPGAGSNGGAGVAKTALVHLADVERKLAEVKATLKGRGTENASSDPPGL